MSIDDILTQDALPCYNGSRGWRIADATYYTDTIGIK